MSVSTSTSTPSKRPSRSSSSSISSSITTVKKSASVSSRTNPRPTYVRNRSTSPDSISRVLHTLNYSRSDPKARNDALEGRRVSAGLGGHRWSHATSSSLSAIDTDLIQRRTSSLRKSSGHTPQMNAPNSRSRTSADLKTDTKPSSKRSSSTSTGPSSRMGSRLAFRDSSNLNIVQGLPSHVKTNTSSRLPASTWEQSSSFNKFGDTVQSLSIQYTTPTTSAGQSTAISDSRLDQSGHPDDRYQHTSSYRTKSSSANSREATNASGQTSRREIPRETPPRREAQANSEIRSPRRRDMLSRALAKANEAVILDNAQNVNAAIEAYNEACELLQQVMLRSADLADRRKLSSIKATYSRRIAELHDFDNTFEDLMRPLPDDPPADGYDSPEDFYHEDASYQHRTVNDTSVVEIPLRQESLLPEIFGGDNYIHDRALPPVPHPISSSTLNVPMDEQYMPAPLSPRPPPAQHLEGHGSTPTESELDQQGTPLEKISSDPGQSTWLDQSGDRSSKSSSRLSSGDYGKKDDHLMSSIEAEFDAMYAVVDSAYDDLDHETTPRNTEKNEDILETNRYDHLGGSYLDDDAEDEEQLLEGIMQDADLDESQLDHEGISALPRQSDSSGFSGRTWGSSMASTTPTTRTTLSTLTETIEPPIHGPPNKALPEPPRSAPTTNEIEDESLVSKSVSSDRPVGIRDRRMSGQSANQLKIETFNKRFSIAQQMRPAQTGSVPALASTDKSTEPSKEVPVRTLAPAASFSSSFSAGTGPSTPLLALHAGEASLDEVPATPALTQGGSTDDGTLFDPSPSRHGRMMPPPPGPITKKNLSSSNLGKGSLSINTGPVEIESPMTPGSAMFLPDARKPSSAISNPGAPVLTSIGIGGMYLFDEHVSDVRSPQSPGQTANEPVPLEACPDSFLLRPFWLMRCLYQALAHPRGGYISTKLFIPRDIWRVRNVKIKSLDDKISQCDLLTAALQKLSKVDTLDASAVLEELQSFETILDQVRMTLSKKLGSDVGVTGSSTVFRSSPATEDSTELVSSRSGNTSSAAKTIASGWRKLRSKSSSANLSTNTRPDPLAQNLTMATLPMTPSSSVPTSRSYSNARRYLPPPTPSGLSQMSAPHAHYMSALARLFDAVQILDSIARQAEDPGLKCSSQTHVGLELSVRNAAEFFAFYIIRFVMADLLMLLDKFLKKGGEWVTE